MRARGRGAWRTVAPAAALVASAALAASATVAPPAPATGGGSRPAPVLRSVDAASLRTLVRKEGHAVTLVNVWATWCVPCREELPDLLSVFREWRAQGMRLVLVSADFDDQVDAVRAFLASQGVDFPTYLKQGADQPFIDALSPRWSGALPATFVYDSRGDLRVWWEGEADRPRFEESVRLVLEGNGHEPEGASK